jgi:hypothetical protein
MNDPYIDALEKSVNQRLSDLEAWINDVGVMLEESNKQVEKDRKELQVKLKSGFTGWWCRKILRINLDL